MRFGLFGINTGVLGDPAASVRVAQAAEAAGFDSVWTAEHVVLPDPQAPPSPANPNTPMLDPAVCLAYLAGQTSTIRLATGIIILPQRNPLVLAKEMASVDLVSGGRLILGVGAGYLHQEFGALGIPMDHRGEKVVEYLEAMRAIWDMEDPSYNGKFVSFQGVKAIPRPVQRPTPTLFMGGRSAPALRRSVTHCHGWYGYALDLERTKVCIDGLRAAQARYDRPPELGTLEITVTPPATGLDAAAVAAYAEMGVDRLVVPQTGRDLDGALGNVERVAAELMSRM